MLDLSGDVLVLAPHTDDGELGCGATISKLIGRGVTVHYVAFSCAIESIPEGMPRNVTSMEVQEATLSLGIKPENLTVFNFKVREFEYCRQAILDEMVRLNREIKPKQVFVPNTDDCHQDHLVISTEAFRAFKNCTVYGYELPWNSKKFNSQLYVSVSEQNLQSKITAIACYKSQAHRLYMQSDFIKSLALVRGTQVSKSYCETFEIIRMVIE